VARAVIVTTYIYICMWEQDATRIEISHARKQGARIYIPYFGDELHLRRLKGIATCQQKTKISGAITVCPHP
jgi:hypothetical protein